MSAQPKQVVNDEWLPHVLLERAHHEVDQVARSRRAVGLDVPKEQVDAAADILACIYLTGLPYGVDLETWPNVASLPVEVLDAVVWANRRGGGRS